ncbi:hypothetical protein H3N56_03840 [Cetobacterium sp. 2A]|uniref:hypothetical protein n=1 Tax=Cetobacterium sp. 2A TaxID=2754723 RepID=UPI00163BD27D|nr:hypothetical protein [Cetobacterium sp. 2A]MBC2855237.1 hypothetical protein [Cetobacterium sp. 2A]MBC2855285.1 hypothetical protein [Cetobacterium sp. 2A]MBC2855629.1 hypothetical protein [Cetobacterium sp. 2A]
MSISSFKKSYYALLNNQDENALLNKSGLKTLLTLIMPLASVSENEFKCTLTPGESVITLSQDFILNKTLKVSINGILLSLNQHYTVDTVLKQIMLNEKYKYKASVLITEYISNLESRYDYILESETEKITLPSNFNLSKLKIFINGYLLSFDKHYSINYANKEIILKEKYKIGSEIAVLGG